MTDKPESMEVIRSSRDADTMRIDLERWLATKLAPDAAPIVERSEGTSANGMSSETVLFDASWADDGERATHHLVARIAPEGADVPVFPKYELDKQYEIMRLVGELTDVPVPEMYWYESDPSHLGAPFFVMSRIDGRVPPDVMPYNFGDSWLSAEPVDRQQELVRNVVDVLVELHSMPVDRLGFLEHDEPGDTALRRHVAHTRAWYEFAVNGLPRSPLVERGFEWLDENWPDEGETVLSWGDSRIGNMMFDGVTTVAVFDWEMGGLAPRALELAWLVYAHRVFEDIAAVFELPGMPDFLRAEDVRATYIERSGVDPGPLDWYLTYCAVQWGIVFLRTSRRSIHFGEIPEPDDIETTFQHTSSFEAFLRGEF